MEISIQRFKSIDDILKCALPLNIFIYCKRRKDTNKEAYMR